MFWSKIKIMMNFWKSAKKPSSALKLHRYYLWPEELPLCYITAINSEKYFKPMREKMVKRVDLCDKEKQRQKEKHKMMCEKMFKPLSSKPDIVGKKNSIILCRLA